ncbi:MAG: adenylosuccinate lyase [Candidatus Saccharibacteria bacterium]|nr:adenylosuccinate lyase [Candidatus Saccharibacteria bacterium]
MARLNELTAVSSIDGRYHEKTQELDPYLSEFGLIHARVQVECALLIALTGGSLPDVPHIDPRAHDRIQEVADQFDIKGARQIKKIEGEVNHDVKAVELWLRRQFKGDETLGSYLELIHFGVTSEDINNNAYNLMVEGATSNVIIPRIDNVIRVLDDKSDLYAHVPILGETHGQPASPTTIGKEMRVFATRLERTANDLSDIALTGKLNGATGNYNAMVVAYPEVDWPQFARDFVESLGTGNFAYGTGKFEFNGVTTQIEPHDTLAKLFNTLSQGNTQIVDLSSDMWAYIERKLLKLKVNEKETGSSTMPHKVNPIDFENAEGNAGLSTALLQHLAIKLPRSRMQRDLSDSTALRSIGTAFGHTTVALKSLEKGLYKILPNEQQAQAELEDEWEVLTEAIQTVGRKHGVKDVYNIVKDLSRGKHFNRSVYIDIVDSLDIPAEAKISLLTLTPSKYIGLAPEIAREQV